ncbi:Cytochrome p450, partial [Globisporangium polare]
MLSVQQLVGFTENQPTATVVSVALGALVGLHLILRALTTGGEKKHAAYTFAKPASSLPILKNTLDIMFYHRERFYDWIADECEAAG